jgi:hypothetical protein
MNLSRPALVLLVVLSLTQAAYANEAHDIISGLSEPKRNEVLTAFMRKSGEACNVTQSFFQGFDKKKGAFWSVACTNRSSYSILLNNDATGSSKILDCKVLLAVAKMDCFKKF